MISETKVPERFRLFGDSMIPWFNSSAALTPRVFLVSNYLWNHDDCFLKFSPLAPSFLVPARLSRQLAKYSVIDWMAINSAPTVSIEKRRRKKWNEELRKISSPHENVYSFAHFLEFLHLDVRKFWCSDELEYIKVFSVACVAPRAGPYLAPLQHQVYKTTPMGSRNKKSRRKNKSRHKKSFGADRLLTLEQSCLTIRINLATRIPLLLSKAKRVDTMRNNCTLLVWILASRCLVDHYRASISGETRFPDKENSRRVSASWRCYGDIMKTLTGRIDEVIIVIMGEE